MPGIEEVDRQYRRTVRLDGVTMEEAKAAAERVEEVARHEAAQEGVLRAEAEVGAAIGAAIGETSLQRGYSVGYREGRAHADQALSEDRREVRRQALTLAAHVLPETPAAALADGAPIEEVTLRIARAFERYLLGDDPPKPPAKMGDAEVCGGGDEPCLWPDRCHFGKCRRR